MRRVPTPTLKRIAGLGPRDCKSMAWLAKKVAATLDRVSFRFAQRVPSAGQGQGTGEGGRGLFVGRGGGRGPSWRRLPGCALRLGVTLVLALLSDCVGCRFGSRPCAFAGGSAGAGFGGGSAGGSAGRTLFPAGLPADRALCVVAVRWRRLIAPSTKGVRQILTPSANGV